MYYSVIGSTWVFGLYQCLWSLYRFAAPWNRRLHAFKLKTSVCVSFFAKLHQTKQLSNACRFSPFPKCIFIFSPAPGMKGVSCGSFVFWGEGGGRENAAWHASSVNWDHNGSHVLCWQLYMNSFLDIILHFGGGCSWNLKRCESPFPDSSLEVLRW